MAGDHGLSDIRFGGYSNENLAEQVDALRNGAGTETLQNAMKSLVTIGAGLLATDDALREQLRIIGVTWEGQAADGGTSATENAAVYAQDAIDPVTDSVRGVGDQTSSFHTTSNGAPDSGTLRGPTEENGIDQVAGFFGHTTDHAQQVKETNAARDAAVDSMNNYQSNSSAALAQARTLPVPPGINLNAQPVDTSTHISSVGAINTGSGGPFGSSGAGPGGPSFTSVGTPGGGPPGIPTTGGTPPVPGIPPIPPGGPLPTGSPLPLTAANPLGPAALRANPLLMSDAATMMGSGAASGAGAGAERDRLVRNPGAKTPGRSGTPLGAAPEEEARAARNAERFGARSGQQRGSIMQPAAGRNAEGEEDQEHVRRYGVESSDVFDDERVVAPEAIGDDGFDR